MKILYVRHGTSMANANGTIGTPDTPLAQEGLEQARVAGHDLKNHNVTKIICSSFIRAQQTAEIIAGELGIAIENISLVAELRERSMGELEGGPKNYETAYFYQNDTEHGFESQAGLIARMQAALQKVKSISEENDGTTVVVGHAISGFYFLQVAKGRNNFEDFDPLNQMSNAEFIEVELVR